MKALVVTLTLLICASVAPAAPKHLASKAVKHAAHAAYHVGRILL